MECVDYAHCSAHSKPYKKKCLTFIYFTYLSTFVDVFYVCSDDDVDIAVLIAFPGILKFCHEQYDIVWYKNSWNKNFTF